jgi:acyl-coenzyme A synthetase/AMP-(fatty) acid ligase
VFGTLYAGGTIVICPKWILIDRVFSDIQQYKITNFITVPTIFSLILKRSEKLANYDLTSLQGIGFGGGRCLVKNIKALNRLFQGKVRFYHGYGMTETACHAFYYTIDNPETITTELLPLGQPIDDTEYFVLTNNRLATEGETGELVIRGYHLMAGYDQLPEETARRLRLLPDEVGIQISDKVLYTGDLVRLEGGNIYFVGREDEQVKVSGYRIELTEVEKYIGLNHEVSEVAVISLPDTELENTLHCFVTVERPIDEKKLIEHSVALGLKTFMVPTKLYIVNEIEKNNNGKIDKTKLIKIAKDHMNME